jgi:hypothetical protein
MSARWHTSTNSRAEPGWWFHHAIPVTLTPHPEGVAIYTEHAQSADAPTHVARSLNAAFAWAEAWWADELKGRRA